MSKLKQNYKDLFDWVWFVMKTRQDNDMIDGTSAFYAENNTKPSWPIRSGVGCDKNKIGQWRDRFYKYSLCFHETELSWLIGLSVDSD